MVPPRIRESDLISKINKEFFSKNTNIITGIGDDAAVLKSSKKNILLTKDILVEDVDFKLSYTPSFYLGRKSLAVNLSDIASMGGNPRFALLGLALSPEVDSKWIEEFLAGFKSICEEYKVSLVGGDISSSSKIFISVSLIGEGERVFERKGAQPGDLIFVSGYLGEASYGLSLLERGITLKKNKKYEHFLKAFLDPIPQVNLGQELNMRRIATSMIDISDGLSMDLYNLCEASNVGAKIFQDKIPLSERFSSEPIEQQDKYNFALHGGEDFQLLFTAPSFKKKEIDRLAEKITCIGSITEREKGVILVTIKGKEIPLERKGYEHYI